MSDKQAKEKLVDFLDKKVFDPVLRKSEDDFSSDSDKEKFRDVKHSTESEKHRFHDEYKTAEEVKDNYHSDLSSSTGKKKDEELEQLGLPKLPDVEKEFDRLCDRLHVS